MFGEHTNYVLIMLYSPVLLALTGWLFSSSVLVRCTWLTVL